MACGELLGRSMRARLGTRRVGGGVEGGSGAEQFWVAGRRLSGGTALAAMAGGQQHPHHAQAAVGPTRWPCGCGPLSGRAVPLWAVRRCRCGR